MDLTTCAVVASDPLFAKGSSPPPTTFLSGLHIIDHLQESSYSDSSSEASSSDTESDSEESQSTESEAEVEPEYASTPNPQAPRSAPVDHREAPRGRPRISITGSIDTTNAYSSPTVAWSASDGTAENLSEDEDQWATVEVEQIGEEDSTPTATAHARRSAASRRLFATLSRDDEKKSSLPSASVNIARPLPSFSARRGHSAVPSLDQIRSRVAGLGIRDRSDGAVGLMYSPSPSPARGSPMIRTSGVSGHQRSVSCPSPKFDKVWQFGEMTVTVTPPTPRPQPKSPVMGYVLQNAGRPVHTVRFQRSRDDMELLTPPAFELAPGRQQMMEDRAKEAMMTMAALHSASKEQHRVAGRGAQLIGLGWPGSPLIGSPAPATTTMQSKQPKVAFAPQTSPARARLAGSANESDDWRNCPVSASSVGKYVPPGRRVELARQEKAASHAAIQQQPRNRLQMRVPSSAPVRVNSGQYSKPSAEERVQAGRNLINRLAERERACVVAQPA